ncbi:MAG: Beta-hexosaminidase [Fimbriimonadales bacterium]|nr:Beta-hexosaminidase [Fimbriimonadales bacterium]
MWVAVITVSLVEGAPQGMPEPHIIPRPNLVQQMPGAFNLSQDSRISADAGAEGVADFLQDSLREGLGLSLMIGKRPSRGGIRLQIDRKATDLGSEGYLLDVSESEILIRAHRSAGLFYGVQTLRQLLPTASFGSSPRTSEPVSVQCIRIEDAPRFQWRGMHLDVGRHFMPKEFIFRFIDLIALHKFNRFHWHLTEDQGWRIEIRRYPRLTKIGAWRNDTMLTYDPPTFEGRPHGGYYTQDEIRDIVRYASERFVTIVPEIEMPGHSQAAIASYPELGNTGDILPVATRWGVIENVFNVEDETIEFLKGVLTEVLELFPGDFIHVGGDEVPKKQWQQSESAQKRMRDLGLKDEHELQSWFIRQFDSWLAERGRRLIGWDEILEGGLAPGAAVMSWRGNQGGIAAAKAGHDVVMAPNTHTYFDYYQSQDRSKEPHAIGGFLPLEKVYSFEPVPPELSPAEAARILGAQGQIWTEYIRTPQHVEYMMFPRACALAEVVWTKPERKNFSEFLVRLRTHLDRMREMGVNFRPLDAN